MKHRVLCHIVPAPACLVKIIVVIVTPYNVDAGGKAGVIKTILVLSRIYNISLLAVILQLPMLDNLGVGCIFVKTGPPYHTQD